MTPMAGISGGSPKPRNVIAASCKIACGNSKMSPTRSCGNTAGAIWCRAILSGRTPI